MRTLDLWKTERENPANEKVADLIIQRVDDPKPIVRIWRGKALKPCSHYSFKNEVEREHYIKRSIDYRVKRLEEKKQSKLAEKEAIKDHKLDVHVGQIWTCSWGYDQTNVDFYEVVEVRGRAVMLQEIGGTREHTGLWEQYKVRPNRTHKIGEPFKKIVQLSCGNNGCREYISLYSFANAYKWDGQLCHETQYA